jgi:hypothetical protein
LGQRTWKASPSGNVWRDRQLPLEQALRIASQVLSALGYGLGTPAYMSPEQATATRELDGRSKLAKLVGSQ